MMNSKRHLPDVGQWSQSSGAHVIPKRARAGLAGLRPRQEGRSTRRSAASSTRSSSSGLCGLSVGRARLGMTLEPLLRNEPYYRHTSITRKRLPP